MDTMHLKVDGMNCANCANKIEKQLNKLAYVCNATVSIATQKLIVEYEDEQIEKKSLTQKIASIIESIEPGITIVNGTEKPTINWKTKIPFISGIALFAVALLVDEYSLILYAASYALLGFSVLKRAIVNILKGDFFDENFLMSIATIGAFIIGEYPEAVGVMLFYQIGEMFQSMSVGKSRKSIEGLLNIRPEFANILINGGIKKVEPEAVNIDDIILVKPGEKIPLDGIIVEGITQIDTVALTGESIPQDASINADVLSGSINLSSPIKIRATKTYKNSTVSRILEITENASKSKSPTEKVITKFSKIYTPVVVVFAALFAVGAPIITGDYNFSLWVQRALVFLVCACPCALVLSVPLGFFAGIGTASKHGILIKGGNYLQALTESDAIAFDKTGTLTKGNFKVTSVLCEGTANEDYILRTAASVEYMSNHPIAKSIVRECKSELLDIGSCEEIPGMGIKATANGNTILVGNKALMDCNGIVFSNASKNGTVVYVAENGIAMGLIVISDEIKEGSYKTVQQLSKTMSTIMLTGDRRESALAVASELGIDKVKYELLPHQKVESFESLYSEHKRIIFVGDGINDAPVLARADAGIAMGGAGSDSAIEAADIVIMDDKPSKIVLALNISKATMKIIKQNIVFILAIKFSVLALAAFGIASMWLAIFADVGVALIAVLNSMRVMMFKAEK